MTDINREELLKVLKDPKTLKELGIQPTKGIKPLELSEDDLLDPKAVFRALNGKIAEINDFVRNSVDSGVESVKIESQEKEARASRKEIQAFIAKHPLAKEEDVIAIMGPLYSGGKSLTEAYDAALKVTGKTETTDDKEEEKKTPKKAKPVVTEEPKKKPTSLRTMHSAEDNKEVTELKTKATTVEEAFENAWNELSEEGQNLLRGE